MADALHFDLTLYPAPVLRRPALPVTAFDAELERIVAAMLERMVESRGVGLAAPQVGLKKRILVLNASGEKEDARVFVNPEVLERSGAPVLFEEGCLSFPGIFAEIERPEACRVRALDVRGQPFELALEGFESRILQHEHDHLEGVLLVDRMSAADKVRNKTALEELVRDYKRKQAAEAAAGR